MRIDSLTGIRIVAALFVFLSHTVIPEVTGVAGTFMLAGYDGVTLFFVLSGFVLAWNYTERVTTIKGVWAFFVARFARIYPLYLFALAVAVIPTLLAGKHPSGLWLHMLALQAWSPDVSQVYQYNSPGWSIGVEVFLYACFPLLMLALGRADRRSLLVVLVVAVLAVFTLAALFQASGAGALPYADPASAHHWLYRTPLTRLGDFVVGMVAALLIQRAGSAPRWAAYGAQALGGVTILVLMAQPALLFSAWSWDAAYLLPTFLLVWGLASGPGSVLSRFLGSRPMVLLGEASFAFYLLHVPLLEYLDFGQVATVGEWGLVTLVEFFLILFLAIGAHVVVERPAQRWIRGLLDRRGRAPTLPVGGLGVLEHDALGPRVPGPRTPAP